MNADGEVLRGGWEQAKRLPEIMRQIDALGIVRTAGQCVTHSGQRIGLGIVRGEPQDPIEAGGEPQFRVGHWGVPS